VGTSRGVPFGAMELKSQEKNLTGVWGERKREGDLWLTIKMISGSGWGGGKRCPRGEEKRGKKEIKVAN